MVSDHTVTHVNADAAAALPESEVEHDAVMIDGRRRTFTVLGPRGDAPGRPLVLVFHGSRQSAEVHRRFTGDALARLATDRRAVVVHLDGYRGNWNDARRLDRFPARRLGIDDVAFTRAVIDHVAASHAVDPARLVLVGYSNGGQMVLRLLHERPELARAAVLVAATMPAPDDFLAVGGGEPARPIPIALVNGTRDRIVPFAGGTMSRWIQAVFKVGGRMLSAHETAAYLARRNGILSAPEEETLPRRAGSPRGTRVLRTSYRQIGLPPVALYEVRGGGHTVPGTRPSPRVLGRTTADITLLELTAEALAAIAHGERLGAETDDRS
jgi:polyhydroxybutyrate depolymerase